MKTAIEHSAFTLVLKKKKKQAAFAVKIEEDLFLIV